MLDHADPAVVGLGRERPLALRVGGELVDLREVDLLELVELVVDDRSGVRDRRPRALRQRGLGVARELVVRIGRLRLRGRVPHLERDVDDVAAAVERQRLRDRVAVGRGCLEPHVEAVLPRRELSRTRDDAVLSPMVRQSFAEQPRLRDRDRVCALNDLVRFLRIGRIAMAGQRNFADHAADAVDRRSEEIGANGHLFALRCAGRYRCRRRSAGDRRRRSRPRRGRRTGGGHVGRPLRLRGRSAGNTGSRGALRRKRGRRVDVLLVRLPQEHEGEREHEKQDQALRIHATQAFRRIRRSGARTKRRRASKAPGHGRRDGRDGTCTGASPQASFRAPRRAVAALRSRNPSNSERNGSSHRASVGSRTGNSATRRQGLASSLPVRRRTTGDDVANQRVGLERDLRKQRRRDRVAQPEHEIERANCGTRSQRLAEHALQPVAVDGARQGFPADHEPGATRTRRPARRGRGINDLHVLALAARPVTKDGFESARAGQACGLVLGALPGATGSVGYRRIGADQYGRRDALVARALQTESRVRPLARRADRTFRPPTVFIRARKPCVRARRIFEGWNVRFIAFLSAFFLSRRPIDAKMRRKSL